MPNAAIKPNRLEANKPKPYPYPMEVHFSTDTEMRLQQVALANGKNAEQLVRDTVDRMLENQARFIAGVQRGLEQADRGELVAHSEVVNQIDRLLSR